NAATGAGVMVERLDSIQLGFQQPSAGAVGEADRLYLLDGVSRRVWVISAAGELVERLTVMPENRPTAHLPTDLALSDSHLYVADPGGERIWRRRFADGAVSSWQPNYQGQSLEPSALLIDEDRLYFTDRRGHRVCYASLPGLQNVHCWGEKGDAAGQFRFPYLMGQDTAGYLLVTDVLNGRLQMFHPNGRLSGTIGRFGTTVGTLYRPNGVAVLESGEVLVSDVYQGSVSVFAEGRFQDVLRDAQGAPLQFQGPVGMAVAADRLYLVDALNNSLEVLRLLPAEQLPVKTPVQESLLSRKQCLICHLSWDDGEQALDADQAHLLPVTQPKMCFSCHHGAVEESRHQLAGGEQHPSLPMQKEQQWVGDSTALAEPLPGHLPLQDSGHLRCGSCHTPHQAQETTAEETPHPNSWLRRSNDQSELCIDCHQAESETDPASGYRNHPRTIRLAEPPYVGAEGYTGIAPLAAGLPKGLVAHGAKLGPEKELICESCHRVHGAVGKPLLAENDSNQLCASCHEQQYAADQKQAHTKGIHPVAMTLDEPLKVAGHEVTALSCSSCHEVHGEGNGELLLRGGLTAEALCQECHPRQHSESKEEAHRKGVHPVGVKLDQPVEIDGDTVNEVGCLSCHSVHHGQPESAALRVTAASGELCQICHGHAYVKDWAEDQIEAKHKGVHPVNLVLEEAVEINGKRINSITCLSCHSPHQGVEQSAALVESDRDGMLCKNCHEPEVAVKGSDHDLARVLPDGVNRLDQQHRESGLCSSCHSLHRAGEGARALFVGAELPKMMDDELQRDQACFACHSEKGQAKEKKIEAYTHPYRHLILRADPELYPLLNPDEEIDEIGRIACISCHNPHRWQRGDAADHSTDEVNPEGSVLNSFLRQHSPGGGFCTHCHGLEAQLKYKYYHDSKSRQTIDDFDGAYLQNRVRSESVPK
ncbi:MAG: hypothetical protein MI754_17970, partial [Chromatiales bacterium]|nr:hypothetical protein [Chromatiales bacterium]